MTNKLFTVEIYHILRDLIDNKLIENLKEYIYSWFYGFISEEEKKEFDSFMTRCSIIPLSINTNSLDKALLITQHQTNIFNYP